MSETTTEKGGEASPDNIAFWLDEARLLKQSAELSWNSDAGLPQQAKLIYSPQQNRVVNHAIEELGVELNLLYRYLISLAIQYLAIGLLIERDSNYFLSEPPGHRIVALLQACDFPLSSQQLKLLKGIEGAYEWGERYPTGDLGNGHDELRLLSHRISKMDCLSPEEKAVLDALYAELEQRAGELAS